MNNEFWKLENQDGKYTIVTFDGKFIAKSEYWGEFASIIENHNNSIAEAYKFGKSRS